MTPLPVKVSHFVNIIFAMKNIEIHNTLRHLAAVCKTMQLLLDN